MLASLAYEPLRDELKQEVPYRLDNGGAFLAKPIRLLTGAILVAICLLTGTIPLGVAPRQPNA